MHNAGFHLQRTSYCTYAVDDGGDDKDVSSNAKKFLKEQGYDSCNILLLYDLMDNIRSNRVFCNMVTYLVYLVETYCKYDNNSKSIGDYTEESLVRFKWAYFVWDFPQSFTERVPLLELRNMFKIVMALYERNEPCLRDVPLFLHIWNVLTERLHMCDNEEEKNSIQNMLTTISKYFATHVLKFFTHEAPLSDLQSMVEMVMALHGESKELRLTLMVHFSDMRDILNELVSIVGSDANESTSIRAMLKTLEDLQPEQ
jgi:hypothetical protein